MKKLGLLFKDTSEQQIKDSLKESESVFIMNYSKVSSPDLSNLRQSLRGMQARIFMVKNSVARRALKDSGLDTLVKTIEGPCGLVFIKTEPVDVSRVLCEFARSHELLKLCGGSLQDRILDQKDIEALSKLPTKEVLRAQLVAILNSPLSRMTMVLKKNLNSLVYILEEKQKKAR
ncbi:MAG: 50S ribosomal protein L10 [Candidatus Omnitrophica bacterium]|nr:50S ribosomal protein L10 [Candidatus Omnitrophota bacterium]